MIETFFNLVHQYQDAAIFAYSCFIMFMGYKLGSWTKEDELKNDLRQAFNESESLRLAFHAAVRNQHAGGNER